MIPILLPKLLTMQLLTTQTTPIRFVEQPLHIDSTIQDLMLYQCEVDSSQFSIELSRIFEENIVLPGVILRQDGAFLGMLSRRQFLEVLSCRYGPELFLKRAIHLLYDHVQREILILPAQTKIADAIQHTLARSPELLFEPIIVQLEQGNEKLLDVHHLLLAHMQVHELTTKLLHQQTQSKLLQTEKMASLGELVTGVAHEILNPVNFICGNLDYLSTYSEDLIKVLQAYEREFPNAKTERLKEELGIDFLMQDLPKVVASMQIGSDRLRKIVLALRSFSHMNEAIKRPLDIHECLDNTLLILNSRIKNGIAIVKSYGQLPHVNCFSGQVSQVFTNLIANAIDALTERIETNSDATWKPQIEITTRLIPRGSAPTNLKFTSDYVEILFRDNGTGIAPEIQTKIFETFFTTKPVGKGTGFGLAIARQIIVEKHGGDLTLQSIPGSGTTFTVILPLGL